MFKELQRPQKILLILLYGLLALMVFFSIFAAMNNFGEKGMQKCMDQLAEKKINKSLADRPKDIYNCCQGAGGKIAQKQDSSYTCIFD
ncbi:MAG: hypothetical protein AABX05_04655 [Nanoarchaeota archaeon]